MNFYGSYTYNEVFANLLGEAFNASYSDKASSHNYHIVYSHILADREVNNFLEIGLFLNELQHTDLNAWSSVYPSANIYGADIKEAQLFNRDNIKTTYVDQTNNESFNLLKSEFPVEFDIIIDDASHMHGPTINTFENMFSTVKSGGVYIIEDCQNESPSKNGWQHSVSGITAFLEEKGCEYQVFESQPSRNMVDPDSGEETSELAPSDDYIICVYKP